ncbi:MAG: PAS domain S-box protein, partial [Gemmatimonadota bacterium]
MFRKIPLVWKLSGVILVILGSVLGVLTYATNLAYERDALVSAREVARVNAQTILHGIRDLMMDRDTAGMGDLFGRLVFDTETHREIKLVSHGGRVVVSTTETTPSILEPGSWPCNVCHWSTDMPGDSTIRPFAEISEAADGNRVISVVTPIYREESCDSSGCHTEPATSPILGMLQADFSLARVDDLIALRFRQTAFALLISILLCSVATWLMVDRLVGRRIRTLRDGAERVSRKDLSFRFGDSRGDGIAQLSGTFDDTVSELSATLSELTNTKEYLQGIVESSADIIITVDPAGLIKTFNTGAERALEYDREEVIGERIEVLFADPGERDAAIEQLRDSDHVVNYETHFLTKNGEVRDVILTLSRLRTPDGEAIGTFGISKDVTQEKKLQRELL